MFNQHYRFMVLLCGPLSSLEAAVPKMTPMDGEGGGGGGGGEWRAIFWKFDVCSLWKDWENTGYTAMIYTSDCVIKSDGSFLLWEFLS